MAYSRVTYTGDGSARSFTIPFLFLDRTHVTIKVAGVLKTLTTDYVWLTDSTIQFVTAPASPLSIFIERVTPSTTRLVDFQDASVLTAADLDLSANQNFYIGQEAIDRSDNAATVDVFAAGVGFTAGSTTTLTLTAGADVDATNVTITFDGIVQHSNTWTLATSGIVTFGAAIPVGTLAVQIAYAAPVTAGFGDGSVTTIALNESVFEGLTTTVPTVLDSVPFADQSSAGNKKKATVQSIIDLVSHPANPIASTTTSGIVELATDTETQTGTDTTRSTTPASVASLTSTKSHATNGYQKLAGGLYMQWGTTGTVANDGNLAVSFPTAFPSTCYNVVVTGIGGLVITGQGEITVDGVSASGFTLHQGSDTARTFYWQAIGV